MSTAELPVFQIVHNVAGADLRVGDKIELKNYHDTDTIRTIIGLVREIYSRREQKVRIGERVVDYIGGYIKLIYRETSKLTDRYAIRPGMVITAFPALPYMQVEQVIYSVPDSIRLFGTTQDTPVKSINFDASAKLEFKQLTNRPNDYIPCADGELIEYDEVTVGDRVRIHWYEPDDTEVLSEGVVTAIGDEDTLVLGKGLRCSTNGSIFLLEKAQKLHNLHPTSITGGMNVRVKLHGIAGGEIITMAVSHLEVYPDKTRIVGMAKLTNGSTIIRYINLCNIQSAQEIRE